MPRNDDIGEWALDAVTGEFRASEFSNWIRHSEKDDDLIYHIRDGIQENMSLEWIAITAAMGVPSEFDEWERVIVERHDNGWDIQIVTDGEPVSIFDTMGVLIDDQRFKDLFWSDLYFDIADEGIPLEKEYQEAAT